VAQHQQLVIHASLTALLARLGHLITPVAALLLGLGITSLRGSHVSNIIWGIAVACFCLLVPIVVRGSRVGFALRYDGVEIDNLYRSAFIPWAGVEGFSWPGQRGRLLVHRHGGHRVAVDATAGLRGHRRRNILSALTSEAERQAASAPAAPRPMTASASLSSHDVYLA